MPGRIFLTGFMAAGKTTVGRRLASRLALPFVDLDEEVERREGASVRELFEREGEAGFRLRELAALRAVLEWPRLVLATGGGTAVIEPAASTLRAADGVRVWLDVPFATLVARLTGSSARPLAGTESETEALYRTRQAAYRDCDLRVEIRPDDTADEIARRIEEHLA